ncbi:alanine--tRNA ligase [bacterium BMS3Bbin02]|nr:alanine--tRNA ligase [bacterium BMS3Bbin02]
MQIQQIRSTFLDFFEKRGHTVVPSASLIPIDPTLLLTVAGMVPFKPYLLGEEPAPYLRATSVQKCIRTGDIDIVGTTARHMTFFEMLGSFSFGDYFKQEACAYAYDLMTEGFGFDPERLWYTVHKTDDDAAAIWIDQVGVPAERVQRGDKDNFWQMGVAGPCGLSSEIFYDRGDHYGHGGGAIGGDEDRFVEIWNLVFMAHIQDVPYNIVGDLPAKNIDTGAGLERIAMALQGTETLFETDEVRTIIAAAENATGKTFGANGPNDVSLKILADHGRAVAHLINDKVVPSNEGRGYILRRLLRRAVRHGYTLGATDLIIPTMVNATIDVMGEAYPSLQENRDSILTLAEREEVQFRKTLEAGNQLLDNELATLEDGEAFSGGTAFKLHDTFGFPVELTEEILAERGIELDRVVFDVEMEAQRDRARAAFKGAGAADAGDLYRTLLRDVDPTEFIGYGREAGGATTLAILREGESVQRADAGQDIEVFLDRTPFYAESGGQMGDTGTLTTATGTLVVRDTQHALQGIHGHRGRVSKGYVQVGQEVTAVIDHQRREYLRKNHTGTHLLHAALRDVIGDHVQQAGSLVAPDRLRFDFNHYTAVAPEELRDVELLVNEQVIDNAQVDTLVTSKTEAERMGAIAFFGDKYGDEVRVVKTGEFSTEFCGGTHVSSTGQVGPLLLISEGSVGSNVRRVEALTGVRAYEHLVGMRRELEGVAAELRTQPGNVLTAAQSLNSRMADQEARIEQFEAQTRSHTASTLADDVEMIKGAGLLVVVQDNADAGELRALAYQLREQIGSGVAIVGSVNAGKGVLVGIVSDDLVAAGVSAGDFVGPAARVLGGGGSRDPQLSQAGGPNGDRMAEALETARSLARDTLAGR